MNCWQANSVWMWGWLVWLLLQSRGNAQAQSFVAYTGKPVMELRKGREKLIKLVFTIEEGFYIQGNKLSNEQFIPTELKITAPEGIQVGDFRYPEAATLYYGEADVQLEVFQNTLGITVPIKITGTLMSPADVKLQGSLYYQACSKTKCYYPRELDFTVNLKVK